MYKYINQNIPQFKGTFLVVGRLAGPFRMPLCGPARFWDWGPSGWTHSGLLKVKKKKCKRKNDDQFDSQHQHQAKKISCTDLIPVHAVNTYKSINGFAPFAFAGLGPLGTDRRWDLCVLPATHTILRLRQERRRKKNTRLDKRQQTASISFIVACSMFSVSRAAITSSPGDGRERKRGGRAGSDWPRAWKRLVPSLSNLTLKVKLSFLIIPPMYWISVRRALFFYDIFYKNIKAEICEISRMNRRLSWKALARNVVC